MSNKAKVAALARKLGATIDVTFDDKTQGLYALIDSPEGLVWKDTGTHAIILDTPDGRDREKEWGRGLEYMQAGLRDCTIRGCEICNP